MNPRRGDWQYVLSAGRTGTVFLAHLLSAHAIGVTAVHEPSPTRWLMMAGNLRNDWRIGGRLLKNAFERSRNNRLLDSKLYVEINPFLCPITDLLPDPSRALRVVHLVREPGDWARSITSFKASTRFRRFIDLVPFAKPYPSPRPAGWRGLSEVERALWRWRWCNERIGALRSQSEAYAIVRYEDLFSDDVSRRNAALDVILGALGLRAAGDVDWPSHEHRLNPGPARRPDIEMEAVERICGDLSRRFGYVD